MGKGGRCPETQTGRYARCEAPKPSWGSSACGGHWRAGCSERRTPGSGRGGWKSAHVVTRQPPTPRAPHHRALPGRDARARLEEFALTLHPDKTRLIAFGRFAADRRAQRGLGQPETFRFLGFTYICGRSRRGTFQLQRKSRTDRMRATLRRVKDVLRRRRHQPIPVQGRWLTQVVSGYFAYHAVPTDRRALMAFRHHVTDLWRRTLRRRSQKDRLTWARMAKLADAWLPRPHLLHPWPSERFAVRHPRWEPSARIGLARICAGGAQ